ncbi:hypothetical protein Mpe_A0751 [Methylibium petroleiphilum PM1]|uniref:Uncharacterized protein n=1 Tax=Methylibium petroleiphilum (strain ATCC BAA-1232 / LMG 22953 / PM1) TaxID=420662 RepID=A2SDS4_METPP|nr:hypothetical protein Mpe_A0751 [Methylibium petroleiphilum PM1]
MVAVRVGAAHAADPRPGLAERREHGGCAPALGRLARHVAAGLAGPAAPGHRPDAGRAGLGGQRRAVDRVDGVGAGLRGLAGHRRPAEPAAEAGAAEAGTGARRHRLSGTDGANRPGFAGLIDGAEVPSRRHHRRVVEHRRVAPVRSTSAYPAPPAIDIIDHTT